MTEEEIWDWQCKMHIWSCYLYEVEDQPALDDPSYDSLCQILLRRYDQLPAWYRERVTKGDLTSGSGSAVAPTLTPDEITEARWRRDVHIPAMTQSVAWIDKYS